MQRATSCCGHQPATLPCTKSCLNGDDGLGDREHSNNRKGRRLRLTESSAFYKQNILPHIHNCLYRYIGAKLLTLSGVLVIFGCFDDDYMRIIFWDAQCWCNDVSNSSELATVRHLLVTPGFSHGEEHYLFDQKGPKGRDRFIVRLLENGSAVPVEMNEVDLKRNARSDAKQIVCTRKQVVEASQNNVLEEHFCAKFRIIPRKYAP